MGEKRHVTSSDGRARVAYEMALGMWHASNNHNHPKIEDQDAFLALVEKCTNALAYGGG